MRILLPLLRRGKTDTHSLGKWHVPSRLDREAGWDPSSPSPSLAPACPSPIPGLPSSHIFLKPSISPPILCRTSRQNTGGLVSTFAVMISRVSLCCSLLSDPQLPSGILRGARLRPRCEFRLSDLISPRPPQPSRCSSVS